VDATSITLEWFFKRNVYPWACTIKLFTSVIV
jgi:hypothetical protein